MERGNGGVYIVVTVFALLVLAGFYFMFDKIAGLQATISDLELQMKTAALSPAPSQPQTPLAPVTPAPTGTQVTTTPTDTLPSIPTAIIVSVSSSPALQPQSKLTVQVEKVTKSPDGTVALSIKVFTGEATSYTAFDPKEMFQILNLDTENTMVSLVTGSFSSMPPKGAVSGSVLFKTDPSRNTFILQVGLTDNAKFYEFDWTRKTYAETVVG